MSSGYEEIANAALALPPQARVLLAEDLIASLESQDVIDEAWRVEIEKRIKDIRDGKVELIPGEQVMSELRAQLKG
jgi:putative addiction module component (TIGR02574 family)